MFFENYLEVTMTIEIKDRSDQWSDKGIESTAGSQVETEFNYPELNEKELIPAYENLQEEQEQNIVTIQACVSGIVQSGHLPRADNVIYENGELWDDAKNSYDKYKARVEEKGGEDPGWQKLSKAVNPAKPSDGEVSCIIKRHSNSPTLALKLVTPDILVDKEPYRNNGTPKEGGKKVFSFYANEFGSVFDRKALSDKYKELYGEFVEVAPLPFYLSEDRKKQGKGDGMFPLLRTGGTTSLTKYLTAANAVDWENPPYMFTKDLLDICANLINKPLQLTLEMKTSSKGVKFLKINEVNTLLPGGSNTKANRDKLQRDLEEATKDEPRFILFRNDSLAKYNDPASFKNLDQRMLNTLAVSSKWQQSVLKKQLESEGFQFPEPKPAEASVNKGSDTVSEVIEDITLEDIDEQAVDQI